MAKRVKLKFKQADGTFVEYKLDISTDDVLNSDGSKTLSEVLSGYSKSGHTHNYAGSSSAGGAATSANKVNSTMKIQLNGGTTEGTNQFTFDGSSAKTVNITPSSIGAAAASHGTHLSLGTGSGNAYYGDKGKVAYDHSQAAHAPSNAQKNSDITKAEIEAKLTGTITSHNHSGTYAAASHGNHVPATETANNAKFLRNDNTWATVTPANIGAAASSHGTHVTYATDSPKANGTAAVGTANNVARGDHVHPLQTTVSGNAGSATKLQTARNITVGNKTNSFNGTDDISFTLSDIGAMPAPSLTNKLVSGNTLTLSTDRYQYVENMTSGTTIILPTVTTFTEIHLFFSADDDLTLILPNILYQKVPEVVAGSMYEFIFTYVGNQWICGYIEYGNTTGE